MTSATFNPLAEQELIDAADYYETQRRGLGLEVLEEVEQSINFLVGYPEAGARIRDSVRRLVIPKFPYAILYRILETGQLRILAIAHHKRRPQYWVERE